MSGYSYNQLETLLHAVKIQRPALHLPYQGQAELCHYPSIRQESGEDSLAQQLLYNSNEYTLGKEEQQFVDRLRSLGMRLGLDVNLPQQETTVQKGRTLEPARTSAKNLSAQPCPRQRRVKKSELNKFILSRVLSHGFRC